MLGTMRKILTSFFGHTTIHGLNRIVRCKHKIGKLIWATLVLVCFGMCVRQIINLTVQYTSDIINTRVSIRYKELDFPTVSFCNLNPASLEKLKTFRKKYNFGKGNMYIKDHLDQILGIVEDIQSDVKDIIDNLTNESTNEKEDVPLTTKENVSYVSQPTHLDSITATTEVPNNASGQEELDFDNLPYAKEEFHRELGLYANNLTILEEFSQSFDDFMLRCKYQGKTCDHRNFTRFGDDYYGMCYRFKPHETTSKRAGPLFALSLLINVNQKDYIPFISDEAGVMVSIHEDRYPPFFLSNGIAVSTGFKTDISMSVKLIDRLSGIGDRKHLCDEKEEYNNVISCIQVCIENAVRNQCNCLAQWNDSSKNSTGMQLCSTDQEMECMTRVHAGYHNCKCKDPCTERQFDKTISMTKWPAKTYEPALEALMRRKKLSFNEVSDSLLLVNIYYSSLTEEFTSQEPAYSTWNYISDIGGTIGLWVGMSIMSLIEVIELVIMLLRATRYETTCQIEKHVKPDVNDDVHV